MQGDANIMSGIRNTIPATASTFLGIPASNARFWGRRPFDFELDVETRDAEQNNPETGSQNRTRAEQETKHDQAQDRTPTESAPATSASRTRQGPGGTGRKPDTSFPVYIFGRVRFLGRRPLGRESGVSSVSTPIPKGAHAPP